MAGVMVEGGSKAENTPWTNIPTHYYVQFSPDGRVWNYVPDRSGDRQVTTATILNVIILNNIKHKPNFSRELETGIF